MGGINKCFISSLLLVVLSLPGLNTNKWSPLTQYVVYRDKFKTSWKAAQAFCRKNHFDLATIRSSMENKYLEDLGGWIGLYKESEESAWKWSENDEEANFFCWKENEPNPKRLCALKLFYGKYWASVSCRNRQSFLCSDEKLILVKENKTWEEAIQHCRSLRGGNPDGPHATHRYDLASFVVQLYQLDVQQRTVEATTDEVWIGLRYLAGGWFWLGGEPYKHYEDIHSCPSRTSCAVMEKRWKSWQRTNFQMRDCNERKNFLCYKRP